VSQEEVDQDVADEVNEGVITIQLVTFRSTV